MTRRRIIFGPYPPPYGGVAIFTSILYEHLKGHDVKLWGFGEVSGRAMNARFLLAPFGRTGFLSVPGLIFLALKDARGSRILDSTHFFLEHPNAALVHMWKILKKICGFRWIKVLHNGSLPERFEKFSEKEKKLFWTSIQNIDEFVVVSEVLEDWLKHHLKVPQKVSCIRSLLPFPALYAKRTPLRELIQAKYDKLVCSIGAFTSDYGFDQIIEAVSLIREETQKDLHLVLIDAGFVENKSFKAGLELRHPWITVLKWVPHPEVLMILAHSDAFVRAVKYEAYGISRVEALLCGTPVLATKVGEQRGLSLFDFGNISDLKCLLSLTLFDDAAFANHQKWVEFYNGEAEINLTRFKEVLFQ
ncbi:glycosyl transferase group 1 [Chloroherpeton thalassium ATCC 35110]|uniref:Glycosyl transferase group 1 n=1 Tax=Chloroherpeton thalassium (strain ATCC 35110 / GB-78) TaxID=517418 RepID=B3QUW9_CHLT3|nr:glycosyltransferase family 4 protein [Chloroherpeton thalassium]ACF14470.1 glycosyl transferase group 1 [Chloroherpeton thalassium ATCC 35110]